MYCGADVDGEACYNFIGDAGAEEKTNSLKLPRELQQRPRVKIARRGISLFKTKIIQLPQIQSTIIREKVFIEAIEENKQASMEPSSRMGLQDFGNLYQRNLTLICKM